MIRLPPNVSTYPSSWSNFQTRWVRPSQRSTEARQNSVFKGVGLSMRKGAAREKPSSMNDQERITDFICSEKKMSANYDTFASECVNL